jgi:cellulose biosynthesis protein BcsQ
MTPKSYCFASAKGGSGKTILAATIGTLLAHFGQRCLLIDADATTNGMTLLFLEKLVDARRSLGGSADLSGLFDEGEADPLSFQLSQNLSFLPASYVLHDTQKQSVQQFGVGLRAALTAASEPVRRCAKQNKW